MTLTVPGVLFLTCVVAMSVENAGAFMVHLPSTSLPAGYGSTVRDAGSVRARTLRPPHRMSSYDGSESRMSGEKQMEMQELIMDFTDDGRIMLEVKGVKGEACREITEELIAALGDVIHTENTQEYYEERVINTAKDSVKLGWSYDSNKPSW